MEFILASNNQKKLAEMQRILSPLGIEVKTAAMLGLELPAEREDARTYHLIRLKGTQRLPGYRSAGHCRR